MYHKYTKKNRKTLLIPKKKFGYKLVFKKNFIIFAYQFPETNIMSKKKSPQRNRVYLYFSDHNMAVLSLLAGELDVPVTKVIYKILNQSDMFKAKRKQFLKSLKEIKNESIPN